MEQFSVIDPCTKEDVCRQLTYIEAAHMASRQSIQHKDRHFQRAVDAFVKAHDDEHIARMAEPIGYDWHHFKTLSWGDLIIRKFGMFERHL